MGESEIDRMEFAEYMAYMFQVFAWTVAIIAALVELRKRGLA